jgi:hypothetical protein
MQIRAERNTSVSQGNLPKCRRLPTDTDRNYSVHRKASNTIYIVLLICFITHAHQLSMAFFKRLLGQAPKDNATFIFEDDDVYPVHTLDDSPTMRSILITWTICFNDVLDADKLQSSLSSLLEIGDWKKLGGRLRMKVITSQLTL